MNIFPLKILTDLRLTTVLCVDYAHAKNAIETCEEDVCRGLLLKCSFYDIFRFSTMPSKKGKWKKDFDEQRRDRGDLKGNARP